MMKRIVSLFLAIIMVCSFANFAFAVSNDALLSCSASKTQLSPGDELTLTVSLENSPNAKSVALVFNYDATNTFSLMSGEWLLSGALLANFDSKTTVCGTAAIAYMSATNVNGNIFTLKLKVKDSASPGKKDINVSPVIKNDSTIIQCNDAVKSITVQSTNCTHTNKTHVEEKNSTTQEQGWDSYYRCNNCGQLFASNGTTQISEIPYRPLLAPSSDVALSCIATSLEVHPGEETEITLSLNNVPNAKSIALVFNYDVDDTFTLVSGDWLLSGALLANFDSKTTACGTAAIAYMSPVDVNGNIFKLKLKVKETAALGDTEIIVAPVIKNDATTIDCNNASITLKIAEFACQHTNKIHVEAKASSCKEQGWDEYYYCADCNQLFASDGVTEISEVPFRPFQGHTGGEATCKSLAVCAVCGQPYGSLNTDNHKGSTYKINQKEATCYEEGYTGDTYCSDCNAKLSSGSVIEKRPHNPAAIWSTDTAYHWHDCQTEGCGNMIDKAAHGGGKATCIHKAICSICGVEYGEFDSSNHENTEIRDQKDADCCEIGYTGDTYCKDCGAKISSGTVIPATGAHIDSDGHWETDGIQHWHTCSYGTKFDITSHSGGIATCKDKAVCSVCGASYGELNTNNHTGTTYKLNQKEATCFEEGYTGDTYCSDCNAKLSSGTIIEKNNHNPAFTWSTDADYHWHDCQTVGCGNKIDKEAHIGGEATCVSKAVCSVCHVQYGSVDSNNHKNTEIRNKTEATCCEDGYTGDTYCKDCNVKIASGNIIPATGDHVDADGNWETDGVQHWHTCFYGTKFDITSHSGGIATCKDKAQCAVCGVSYGELDAHNHVGGTEIRDAVIASCNIDGYTGDTYCLGCGVKIAYGTVIPATGNHIDIDGNWETDGVQHWHTCSCGTKFDITSHSGGTATCKNTAVCSVCGIAYGELDTQNHTGMTYKLNQKEATCYEEGYTGDTYCSDCNAKLSNGTVIEKTPHDPATAWSNDADYHWHDCQTVGCGNKIDKASHCGGEATCIHKAICSICGVEYGEFDSSNHKNTEIRDQKAAGCCEIGYTGDTYCKDCGAKISSGTVIPATGAHIDSDGHWETDGIQHWHTCSYGTKFDITSHSGGIATCKDKAVCSVCGAPYGEFDATNHVGGTEVRNAVSESYDKDGYTGDTYCKGCGAILVTGQIIPKISHANIDEVDKENIEITEGVTADIVKTDDTAIISNVDISEIGENEKNIVFDLTKDASISSVSITATALQQAAAAEKGYGFKATDKNNKEVSVVFDKEALSAISEDVIGNISVKIDNPEIENTVLHTTKQTELISKFAKVYELTLENAKTTSFGEGNAKVVLYYEKPSTGGTVYAAYIKDDGTTEPVPTSYDDVTKTVTLTLSHFSDYVIYTEPVAHHSSGGGGTPSYSVALDTNGGDEMKNLNIKKGQAIGTIPTPQKKGFVFDGWYSDKELTKEYSADEKVTASTTLYAGWKVDPVRQLVLTIGKKEATVWNEAKSNDVAPVIRNDRTMLPARFVAENLGATVEWVGEEQKVVITRDDVVIILYIDSDKAYVNNEEVTLDSPAFIENDRTYTPLRFIAEKLGAGVDWDEATKEVTITKKIDTEME